MNGVLDCVIVGGGPGGLTGAIYLGRFLRSFVVLDGGDARLDWIPVSHNHPGFPDGVPGSELLERMREQARRYGARIIPAEAVSAAADAEGVFTVTTADGGTFRGRTVLLATGVKDNEPPLPDIYGLVKRGLIRVCPICDGFEQQGKRVGVIGDGPKAVNEALFLQLYTRDLTVLHIGPPEALPQADRRRAEDAGIVVVDAPVRSMAVTPGELACFDHEDGSVHRFDTVYAALGTTPRNDLAEALGAKLGDDERLFVDDHMMTSVPGLYAAGDLVRGLNQISIAQGEAAIAATAIHNRCELPTEEEPDGAGGERPA